MVGTGGVGQAENAVEIIMAGATAVGVHSLPLLRELRWFEKALTRLDPWLEAHGHSRLADLRGLALPHMETPVPHMPLAFAFDEEICRSCGLCDAVCAPGALDLFAEPQWLSFG